MKILINDPDPRVRKSLQRILETEFIIDVTTCAKDAEDLLYQNHYDLLITDTVLPDIEGDHFINLIKAHMKDLPIIVISNRSTVSDKNFAFEQGADDYLVKPINSVELKARIKALIRRSGSTPIDLKENIKIRDLFLDTAKRMIFYKGKRLMLRKKELQLLEYMMRSKGRIVTRHEILEHVWESSANPYTNTVEVHLKRIRDKIEKPGEEKYIETIHGMGYLIIDEETLKMERIY